MKSGRAPLVARWRITSISGWDEDDVNLPGPTHIEFDSRSGGSFQFCAVSADIDYRVSTEADRPIIEWSWAGDDDGTETSGRGWACVNSGKLVGRIYGHRGDEFPFEASPFKPRRG